MKKFLNAIIVLIAFHSNSLISQDEVEETVVVTSALVDTSEINKSSICYRRRRCFR